MPSGTLYRVPVVGTDVSENISPPSSRWPRMIGLHSFILESLLNSLSIEGYYVGSSHTVQVPEGICHWNRRGDIPEDRVLLPYIVALQSLSKNYVSSAPGIDDTIWAHRLPPPPSLSDLTLSGSYVKRYGRGLRCHNSFESEFHGT
jgi:hypothetical protein